MREVPLNLEEVALSLDTQKSEEPDEPAMRALRLKCDVTLAAITLYRVNAVLARVTSAHFTMRMPDSKAGPSNPQIPQTVAKAQAALQCQ